MDKEIWRARLRKCYLTCEVSGPSWVIMSPEVIPGHHPESPHTWQRRYCVAIMEQRGRGQLANGGGEVVPQETTIGSLSSPSKPQPCGGLRVGNIGPHSSWWQQSLEWPVPGWGWGDQRRGRGMVERNH